MTDSVSPQPDACAVANCEKPTLANRACVNPEHLEPVTNAENLRRGREARKAEIDALREALRTLIDWMERGDAVWGRENHERSTADLRAARALLEGSDG